MYLWFQENEKLKAEGAEKSKKVELLNDKISDLLQKNQRYISTCICGRVKRISF